MYLDAKREKIVITSLVVGSILILIAIALPNFVPRRFVTSGYPVTVVIRVFDNATGLPMAGAQASSDMVSEPRLILTDTSGECRIKYYFHARGISRGPATASVRGRLRVEAAGYKTLEQPLQNLLGETIKFTGGVGVRPQFVKVGLVRETQ